MNYYGRFYRTRLYPLLQRINTYLMRWAGQKYKRLRGYRRSKPWWLGIVTGDPELFTGDGYARPLDGDEKSGVTEDCHAPFHGSPGVKVPPGDPIGPSSFVMSHDPT
jgi:hypothetical protein